MFVQHSTSNYPAVESYVRHARLCRLATFQLNPVSEVTRTLDEVVNVVHGHMVVNEEEEGAEPHQNNVLSNPPRIIIQCILHTHTHHTLVLHQLNVETNFKIPVSLIRSAITAT